MPKKKNKRRSVSPKGKTGSRKPVKKTAAKAKTARKNNAKTKLVVLKDKEISKVTKSKSKPQKIKKADQEEKKQGVILSVIIPAYKEEKRIGNTLVSLDKYLSPLGFPYEIIVVIDGSPDNTFQVVEGYQKMIKNLWIINNPENHGKGFVVRQGLLAAKGAYRLFMDADNSTTIDQIENFSPCFEDKEVGVVIGSRDLSGSQVKKHQPKWKEMAGNMGNLMIQMVGGLWGIKDTQCGFKILTAEAAEAICSIMTINRWGFDIEMLVLARKLGYKIKEVPVVWVNDEASTVTIGGYVNTLKELFLIKWNLITGKYDLSHALEKSNPISKSQ